MVARLRVLNNGTLREIKRLRIMQGGILRDIRTLKIRDGDVLRTVGIFATPLSLSVTGNPSGTTSTNTAVAGPVTAVPSGGLSPFSYVWTKLSGSGSVNNPSSATTTFSDTGIPGQIETGTFRCTCTDGVGQTAHRDVLVTFTYRDL